MSRSPAMSGKATATKSSKEKWLRRVQLVREKGENRIGGSSTVTQVEWEKIPAEECQKLIESMPRRIQAVLRAKGGYTKY